MKWVWIMVCLWAVLAMSATADAGMRMRGGDCPNCSVHAQAVTSSVSRTRTREQRGHRRHRQQLRQ
jgi:hypothetical protein